MLIVVICYSRDARNKAYVHNTKINTLKCDIYPHIWILCSWNLYESEIGS